MFQLPPMVPAWIVLSHSFSETQLCGGLGPIPKSRPLSVEDEVRLYVSLTFLSVWSQSAALPAALPSVSGVTASEAASSPQA